MADGYDKLLDRMKALRAGEAQPEQEPEQPEAPEPEQPEAPEPEALLDPEPEPEQPEAPDEPDAPEPVSVSTLEDISKALNVPIEDLYNISVPMSVDGERREVPLGEWKDNYQTREKLQTEQQKLGQYQQELAAKAQQWASMVEQAEAASKVWSDLLEAEEKSIDWKTLREDDPNEYVIRKQEFQDRRAKIEAQLQNVQQQRAQASQEYEQEIQRRQREYLEAQREQLYRALPDWRDAEKHKQESAKISDYLKSRGFNDQEIQGAADHRMILIARDAMLYRDARERAKVGKKEKRAAVPPIKPAARKQPKTVADERRDQLRAQLKKTGKLRDATALYRATRSPNKT